MLAEKNCCIDAALAIEFLTICAREEYSVSVHAGHIKAVCFLHYAARSPQPRHWFGLKRFSGRKFEDTARKM